ncbi:beta-lactamase [Aureococcus anophagefferens]|nr:beta-lactamase [Aureococcus anophagefferens]
MGASLSRREASPDEPGATAPLRGDDDEALRGDESASAPEASAALKRPRSCSKAEVCFTRVLEDGHNVTAILAFAGYRNVLRLEELCPRAWRIVRGAHIELDVSKEKAIIVAVKTAARGELFQARREGVFDIHTHFCFSFNACGRSASDVIYRDDLALMPSPRPRAPALVQGSRGADVDAARNACAIAAAERRRAALLSMGSPRR